jgi:hypothetical protein
MNVGNQFVQNSNLSNAEFPFRFADSSVQMSVKAGGHFQKIKDA